MSRSLKYSLARLAPTHPLEVDVHAAQADAFKLDRRYEPRLAEQAEVKFAATYSDGDSRLGITHMTVVDRSARGMGVRTSTRIDPGMTVTICPDVKGMGWLKATAVRCTKQDSGYVIGLRLSTPRRAA